MNTLEILHKTISQNNLTVEEAYYFLLSTMKGEVSEILLSSWLTALKIKTETEDEILGCVKAMRESAVQATKEFDFEYIDTCGTGGDGKNSINISTLAALTLASMGVKVAKHGNRAVSSLSGSSDILSWLGLNINKTHKEVEEDLISKGFAFLFAPMWHPSMKFAVNVRKSLSTRTVFNILGPLSNPFQPKIQVMGVYSADLMERVFDVFIKLGTEKVIVCHSQDGLDEFSIFQTTDYLIYKDGKKDFEKFDPRSIIPQDSLKEEEIYCYSKEEVNDLTKKIIEGEPLTGTYAVALNSGVALYLLGKTSSIEDGYHQALDTLKAKKVKQYIELLKN